MKLGASTKSFGGISVAQTARIFASAKLNFAELCFCQSDLAGWKYNLCGYEQLPSETDVKKTCEEFEEYGIKVCAIGVYNCFLAQTGAELYNSVRLFTQYCDIARFSGVKLLATHSGTLTFRGINAVNRQADLQRIYDGFTLACVEAHKRGLTIAVECGDGDIISDYSGFLSLKEHIKATLGNSDMLKYIGVPVTDGSRDISDTALFHIKDKKADGRFYERFGDGDGDFSAFFNLSDKIGNTPVIFEYVNSENVSRTVQELSRHTAI